MAKMPLEDDSPKPPPSKHPVVAQMEKIMETAMAKSGGFQQARIAADQRGNLLETIVNHGQELDYRINALFLFNLLETLALQRQVQRILEGKEVPDHVKAEFADLGLKIEDTEKELSTIRGDLSNFGSIMVAIVSKSVSKEPPDER